MLLQVVAFAYNEEPTIGEVICRIPQEIEGVDRIQIAVIDDGSTDRTAEFSRSAGACVISHRRNQGLGAAFASGLAEALANDADILVTVDGDGQFDTGQIPELIRPILCGEADMTTCSRFKDPALVPQMPAFKRWGNYWVAALVSRLTGRKFHDVSCGFRAYNRECQIRLNLMGRFTYTHEAIMELVFKGQHVEEVPLRVRGVRAHGQSRVATDLLRYAWNTSRIMVGTVLNHRPHWFFGRLAMGVAVLGILCATLGCITVLTKGTFIKSLVFVGGFLLGLAALLVLFGFQSRAIHRSQFLLESMLYELRVQGREGRNGFRSEPGGDRTDKRGEA